MISNRFTGELMVCVACGAKLRSHPEARTDWRCIEVDQYNFYVCPSEFPVDGASKTDFQAAYEIVFACCLNEILKKEGKAPIGEVEEYRASRQSKIRSKPNPKGFGNALNS